MIQFNLIPDVKQEFLKTKHTKRLTALIACVVGGFAVVIFIILFLVVNVVQKKHLSDLNKDIKKYSEQIKSNKDLDKVLTVQNQLNSLPALQAQKPVTSRLPGYLSKLTPTQVSIAKLHIDMAAKTIDINGSADSLSTVNKYVDTLKFTKYHVNGDQPKPDTDAFSNVVLTSFSRDSSDTSYDITLSFDPLIFDIANNVDLVVPKIITTRSETEKPAELFQSSPKGGQ